MPLEAAYTLSWPRSGLESAHTNVRRARKGVAYQREADEETDEPRGQVQRKPRSSPGYQHRNPKPATDE